MPSCGAGWNCGQSRNTGEIKPSVAAGLFDQFIFSFSACEHLPEPAAAPIMRSPVPIVMAMAPVDWVTPVVAMAPVNGVTPIVPMAPINRVTPITIVVPVTMVAPVDRFNDALCAFQG